MIQGYDQGLTQVVLGVGDSFIQAGRRRRSIRSVLKEDGQSTARSAPKEAVSLKVLGRKSRISPSKAHPPRNGAVPTIHHPQCALSRRRVFFFRARCRSVFRLADELARMASKLRARCCRWVNKGNAVASEETQHVGDSCQNHA